MNNNNNNNNIGISLFTITLLIPITLNIINNYKNKIIKVKEIWIYPIKSCKGISPISWKISKRGFEYDRSFMLIDNNNKFISQRTYPKMCFIETNIDINNNILIIKAPGMKKELEISLTNENGLEKVIVNIWGDECDAYVLDKDVCYWFNEYLGTNDIKLVKIADDTLRQTNPDYAPNSETGFSDGYPFLLTSIESLDDLNKRLPKPISMLNFRPNIIVQGSKKPWCEDKWDQISFNNFVFMRVVKPCDRCQVPTIDLTTGDKDPNVTRVMKTFRTGKDCGFSNEKWNGSLFFGQNVDHYGWGVNVGKVISQGDEVKVLTTKKF
jgi:uncharacterized protein YcbX